MELSNVALASILKISTVSKFEARHVELVRNRSSHVLFYLVSTPLILVSNSLSAVVVSCGYNRSFNPGLK